MSQKKKLQVFVSSTYQDLREERQAAVEAILTAGHIPAGMELFAAGDISQMTVIKRWIDESDAFLLILGGRYGSIEPDTQKSYIHLEYEYALEAGKPLFAVVITDEYLEERVKRFGTAVIERENTSKLNEFRTTLLHKRIVKFWNDPRDIKLAIYETLADFARRDNVIGWIPGDQAVDTGTLAEELARLTKENADLRRQLSEHGPALQRYNGLTFSELYDLLSSEKLKLTEPTSDEDRLFVNVVKKIAEQESNMPPTTAHALWMLRKTMIPAIEVPLENRNVLNAVRRFEYYGLVRSGDIEDSDGYGEDFTERAIFEITEDGHQFVLRLIVARKARTENEAHELKVIVNADP